jgi:hypothetical protein
LTGPRAMANLKITMFLSAGPSGRAV